MSEISKEQLIQRATEESERWNKRLYRAGYEDAQRKFEQELSAKGETTTLSEATQEQKENWKHYGLTMWCDKCKKGISDHWGLFDYCPFCGRRIVRESK